MNENNLVTIVIPVYNTQDYLEECLDSVINQTYQNLDIICINDGSTDNSLNILKKYEEKDKRIIVIDKENEGSGLARNAGLNRATGEWILFVDSDDILEVHCIQELIKSVTTRGNIDVIRTGATLYDDQNKINVKAPFNYELSKFIDKKLIFQDYKNFSFTLQNPGIGGIFIRRMILIENNLFFRKIKYGQDTEYFFRIMLTKPSFLRKRDITYFYRINRPNNTLTKLQKDFSAQSLDYIKQIISHFYLLNEQEQILFFQPFVYLVTNSFMFLKTNCSSHEYYNSLCKYFREEIMPLTNIRDIDLKRNLPRDRYKVIKNALSDNPELPDLQTTLFTKKQLTELKETNHILRVEIKAYFNKIRLFLKERDEKLKLEFSRVNKLKSIFSGKPLYPKIKIVSKPKVSIIGIFNDQVKYVHKWMDSVQNQSLKDIEIIVVNTNRKNNITTKLLKKYQKNDKRIRVIECNDNKGTLDLRKEGVLKATGKYIMFLDEKDYFYSSSVKTAYSSIEKKETDALVFGSDYLSTKKSLDKQAYKKFTEQRTYKFVQLDDWTIPSIIEEIYNYSFVSTITKTSILTQAFNKVSSNLPKLDNDIFALSLILCETNTISRTFNNLVIQRFENNSIAKNISVEETIKEIILSQQFIINFWSKYNFNKRQDIEEAVNKYLDTLPFTALMTIFTKFETKESREQALEYYLFHSPSEVKERDIEEVEEELSTKDELGTNIINEEFIAVIKSVNHPVLKKYLEKMDYFTDPY